MSKIQGTKDTRISKSRITGVDAKIGDRIKSVRMLLGLTQTTVSKMLGITFQQVQKYEQGINRISSSMLWYLAECLGIDIHTLFPEQSQRADRVDKLAVRDSHSKNNINDDKILKMEPMNKETANLLRAYYSIPDPNVRKKILSLVTSIASTTHELDIKNIEQLKDHMDAA